MQQRNDTEPSHTFLSSSSAPPPAATALSSPSSRSAGGSGGAAVALLSTDSPAQYVSEASLDFQRSLLQQQLQQVQREMDRLKGELQETNTRLADTRQQLNEQKASYTSLTHRYSTAVEKLTNAEGDVKRLEEQLVKERNQRHHAQGEREEQRLALRELQWEYERLQRQLQQLEANRGLDPKEVQRTLEDRSQYIPTVEVHRMQTEMHNTHQSLVDRLLTSLEALMVSSEESQTNFFVARSAVLSAATDVDARLQRAEAALDDVDQQWSSYREGLEKETQEFLVAVMAENKDLWQQLTLLQNEHDVVVAEMRLKSTQGGSVTAEEYAYAQRQLETMTERLSKAQQLVESQTVLARAHEEEMAELLEANDAMQRRIEELERLVDTQEAAAQQKAAALTEADAALRDSTAQIEELQDTLREERRRAETMVAEMKATQRTMQEEYDGRVRQLEHDCGVANDTATTLQHSLEETAAKLEVVERNLTARSREYAELQQQAQQQAAETTSRYHTELQRVQAVMEAEMKTLRGRLEAAQDAARTAARERDDAVARESATAATQRTLEQDVSQLHDEVDGLRRQLKDAVGQRQKAQSEADQLRASHGEGSTLAVELQKRNALLEQEKAELTEALESEKARQEQRYAVLHTDWRTAEKARASLQEEVKTLRTRCGELESASMSQERHTQDKEQLMRENLRLHEQYQLIQRECTSLREEVKVLKQRGEGAEQWTRQMEELQRRLRELPELRQAADAARRDALTAKEETELLRREKDQLAQKLDAFLADAKAQARREDDLERVCREASAAAQRVGGMVSSAKESSARYRVFRNTNPTGRALSTSRGGGGGGNAGSAANPSTLIEVSCGTPRVSSGAGGTQSITAAPLSSSSVAAVRHRSPVHVVSSGNTNNSSSGVSRSGAGQSPRAADPEVSTVRSPASSPSRPWH
jgi:chromosome segregation ATPase